MCRDGWPRVLLLSATLFVVCVRAVPLASDAEYLDKAEVQAELEQIKQRLLANLGLSRVPDVSRANVSEAEMARMMDIYSRSVAESREADDQEDEDDDDSAIHRFYSYRDSAPVNKTSGWQYMFFPLRISNQNGSALPHLSLHSAKLRLRRLCHGQRSTASLYQLLEPWDGSESTDRLLVEERKLKPKNQPEGTSWPVTDSVFDLSRPVSTWLESPALNFGLLLQCSSSVHSRHRQYTSRRAVLDILVKERPKREKRSTNFSPNLNGHNIRMNCKSSNKTKLCCRYSLTVSFKEIGWNFIYQPESFEANFCKGRCSGDLKDQGFASNHAYIQTILSSRKHNVPKVPRPCCAPKKLKSLDVMHLNDKEPPEILVTRYKGMTVKSCACS